MSFLVAFAFGCIVALFIWWVTIAIREERRERIEHSEHKKDELK